MSSAAYAAAVPLLVVNLRAFQRTVARGALRIHQPGMLRLVPQRSVVVFLPSVWSFLLAGPALLGLVAPAFGQENFLALQGSWWLVLLSVVGLVLLLKQVWDLRVPEGLTLTPSGLMGVRGTKPFNVSWDGLQEATAATKQAGLCLQLTLAGHSVLSVPGAYIGSDPNVVAAIIEHFRTHPEDRKYLADGDEAIRVVEAAHATDTSGRRETR